MAASLPALVESARLRSLRDREDIPAPIDPVLRRMFQARVGTG